MHSRVRRLGRRGGLLLMLAVLWVGVAAQVAAALHERIPLGWRVGLWLASALIMAAAAVAGTRDPRAQRIGWAAALFMPAGRAFGYLWSVTMIGVPGPPPGAVSSLAGLAEWCVVTAIVYTLAGWDEDVTDDLAREEDHPATGRPPGPSRPTPPPAPTASWHTGSWSWRRPTRRNRSG